MRVGQQGGLDAPGIHALHILAPVPDRGSHPQRQFKVGPHAAAVQHIGEAVAGLHIKIQPGQTVDTQPGFCLAEESFLVIIVHQGEIKLVGGVLGNAVVVERHVSFQATVAVGIAQFCHQIGE